MYLEKINLINYRNIKKNIISVSPHINILLGNNGQGKTNLLESIYLMGTGSSHRTNINKELITWEKNKSLVQMLLVKKDYSLKLTLKLEGSSKKVEINNTPLEKFSELIGNLNVVLFSPEDLYLIKGSPSKRRDFINIEVSQVSSYYHHLIKDYNHILRQRNNYLKELKEKRSKNYDMLDIWDEKLITTGSKIIEKRLEVIEKLQILARLSHRKITNGSENLSITYESSLGDNLNNIDISVIFRKQLANNRKDEVFRGYTLLGPHRDDLVLKINKIDLRKYGSQGQQRTAALALKLAELEFMKSETGEYPVLLLDDVFSELDELRRDTLLNLIAEKIQTFITATDMNVLGNLSNSRYKIFQVENGLIKSKE
ncbi:MAG: DNA replication/repair protein RecF [Bacillota bacterium]